MKRFAFFIAVCEAGLFVGDWIARQHGLKPLPLWFLLLPVLYVVVISAMFALGYCLAWLLWRIHRTWRRMFGPNRDLNRLLANKRPHSNVRM